MLRNLIYRSLLFILFIFAIAACEPPENAEPTREISTQLTMTAVDLFSTNTPTITSTPFKPLATATLKPSSTSTPTITNTAMGVPTLKATATPTYAILRGEVLVRSNCRYGPGAPYLYKYGLVPGSNLDVIGRNDAGTWILVQAIGGNNPCWVKASLMDVKGDVMSVAPTYIPLPRSPYYAPLWGVSAVRNGDMVTVSWHAVQLRAGDETASPPYLVEAWVCRNGEIVFVPLGVYENIIEIEDQGGCSEASHARVFLVEKHGYTRSVDIPWPPLVKETSN